MSSSTEPNPYSVDGIITSNSSPKCEFYDVPLSSIELSPSPICTHLDEDETAKAEFLAQLETNLLYFPFYEVYEYYYKSNSLNELMYCINEYFDHLQSCMMYPNFATYLDMNELESPYDQFNLASYGNTFWLLLMALYPDEGCGNEFRNYSTIIYHYLRLFPHDLACARSDLLTCFEKVDNCKTLHENQIILLKSFVKPSDRYFTTLNDYLKHVSLPTERNSLYELLKSMFETFFSSTQSTTQESVLVNLILRYCPGHFSPYRITDCADVFYHIWISSLSKSTLLDYHFMLLLSQAILMLFRRTFGLNGVVHCSIDKGNWMMLEFDPCEIEYVHKGEYYGNLYICIYSEYTDPSSPYYMTRFDLNQVKSDIGALQVPNLRFMCFDIPSPKNRFQFSHDFIFTDSSMSNIVSTCNKDLLNSYIFDIVRYFAHLQARLQESNLSYSTLLESSTLANPDYCSYGQRFWRFLVDCGRIPEANLRCCSILICHYLKRIPDWILKAREMILKIHVKLVKEFVVEPDVIDFKLFTFQEVNKKSIHLAVRQLNNNSQQQIDYIIDKVYNRKEAKSCVKLIEQMMHHPKHQIIQLGSLQSGLSIYSIENQFHFIVCFESSNSEHPLDRSTSVLILQLIGRMFKLRFNLDYELISDRMTLKIDSNASPDWTLHFEVKRSNVWNMDLMVNRMSQMDSRIGEVILLLQYWAQCNALESTPVFLWLIIFALQNSNPPVIVPVTSILIEPTQTRYSGPITLEGPSTPELIVHFFKFYSNFDFTNKVICPRDGHVYTKLAYERMKQRKHFTSESCCIDAYLEEPITEQLIHYFTESGNVNKFDLLKNLCNRMLSVGKINAVNCLEVLTGCQDHHYHHNQFSNNRHSVIGCPGVAEGLMVGTGGLVTPTSNVILARDHSGSNSSDDEKDEVRDHFTTSLVINSGANEANKPSSSSLTTVSTTVPVNRTSSSGSPGSLGQGQGQGSGQAAAASAAAFI